jgi:hypothetical protein
MSIAKNDEPTEILPRKRTFVSETCEGYFEDVQAVQFDVLFISFRYCFDQRLGTNAEVQEAVLTNPEPHMPA